MSRPLQLPTPTDVCPTEQALDVIASKWTARLIYLLAHSRVLRFSELRRALGAVTHKELTKQLRRLEQNGLVAREVFAVVPSRVEYQLTTLGATLVEPLQALSNWAAEHAAVLNEFRLARSLREDESVRSIPGNTGGERPDHRGLLQRPSP